MPTYKPKNQEPIEAFQVLEANAPSTLRFNGGPVQVSAGDYLVRADDGSLSVKKKADFEGFYAPVEAPAV